jgi:hypothetical protein
VGRRRASGEDGGVGRSASGGGAANEGMVMAGWSSKPSSYILSNGWSVTFIS